MTVKKLQPVKAGQPISAASMNDHRAATVTQVNGGPGMLVSQFGNVVTVTLDQNAVSRPKVAPYVVQSVAGDYVIAVPWLQDEATGTNDDAVQVKVAKPWGLRQTPFDGTTQKGLTYTYTDGTEREVTDGTYTHTEVIIPPYDAYTLNIIWVDRCETGVTAGNTTNPETGEVLQGEKIKLMDTNRDGRYWAVRSV